MTLLFFYAIDIGRIEVLQFICNGFIFCSNTGFLVNHRPPVIKAVKDGKYLRKRTYNPTPMNAIINGIMKYPTIRILSLRLDLKNNT